MLARTLLLAMVVGCRIDAGDAKDDPSRAGHASPEPTAPPLALSAPERIELTVGRSSTIHVDVPNRDAVDSVLVVDAAQAPEEVSIESTTMGLRSSAAEVIVRVDADVDERTAAGLDSKLSSTRGTESVKHVVVDLTRPAGSLLSLVDHADTPIAVPHAMAISAAGAIAVLGIDSGLNAVLRTTPTGVRDPSFGLKGVADFESIDDPRAPDRAAWASKITYGANGGVVAGGWFVGDSTRTGWDTRSFVRALLPDGDPDTSFAFDATGRGVFSAATTDASGRVILAFRRGADLPLDLFVVDATGAVAETHALANMPPALVAMSRDAGGGHRLAFLDGTIVALHADFTAGSRVTLPLEPHGIAVDAQGRVVVLHDYRIERFSPALDALDTSFVAADVPGAKWEAIEVAPDASIVAIGGNDRHDVLIARFHP